MKLSDAIRRGATMHPQIQYALMNDDGTCALGAALNGLGLEPLRNPKGHYYWPECMGKNVMDNWYQQFPIFKTMTKNCPLCGLYCTWSYGVVSHLNDTHELSREAIAMWVETEENHLENDKKLLEAITTEPKEKMAVVHE